MKVQIVVRDLTVDRDFMVFLPMSESRFNDNFNKEHEYIIIDRNDILKPGEYDSIEEMNNFLIECQERGINNDTLQILSATYLYDEVREMVRNENYVIVDFTSETSTWNYGQGGDYWSENDKGLLLHTLDYMRFDWEKEFKIPKEAEDDIEWENLWCAAESCGWRTVIINYHAYLVCRL